MPTAKAKTVQVGQFVQYKGSKGYPKAALVVGTPDSVTEGKDLPVPQEGHLHLLVFSATGAVYLRHSVPSEQVAADIPDYTSIKDDGTTLVHSCWIPIP